MARKDVSGGFQDDPRAPVFFLSYARARPPSRPVSAPFEVNRHVLKLFTDLTTNVNELVSLSPGQDPGFMDMTIEGSERWEAQVLRAAGTCQVFICLLSTPYFNRSEWCAMEWDLFSRRKVVRRSDGQVDHETGFLPVLWAPVEGEIPRMVAEINRFSPTGMPDPTFAPQYHSDGIYGLLTMELESAYKTIVWKLALQVQQMRNALWVEPLIQTGTADLRRSFPRRAR